MVVFPGSTIWRAEQCGLVLQGVGPRELLATPLTAFYASRLCPGTAIRAATDWALTQASHGCVTIGGFHSPLEQSVLHLLMRAGGRAIIVLARPIAGASLRPEWRSAVATGNLAIISAATTAQRMEQALAADRNEVAAQLAERVVIAYASPSGQLAIMSKRWQSVGRVVQRLIE